MRLACGPRSRRGHARTASFIRRCCARIMRRSWTGCRPTGCSLRTSASSWRRHEPAHDEGAGAGQGLPLDARARHAERRHRCAAACAGRISAGVTRSARSSRAAHAAIARPGFTPAWICSRCQARPAWPATSCQREPCTPAQHRHACSRAAALTRSRGVASDPFETLDRESCRGFSGAYRRGGRVCVPPHIRTEGTRLRVLSSPADESHQRGYSCVSTSLDGLLASEYLSSCRYKTLLA